MSKNDISMLNKKIKSLEHRLHILEQNVQTLMEKKRVGALHAMDFIELPDHLRKTLRAINELVEATAEEVAEKTGRTRTVESIYLNNLTRLGYLKKLRRGHKVCFRLHE